MNSQSINVSTGPVQVSKEVMHALSVSPISHRSKEFQYLYNGTTDFLSHQFNMHHTYLITGSGTAANEAMIYQIKLIGGEGLILSNGEFGQRLIEQATRASLRFKEYDLLWGEAFDLKNLEMLLQLYKADWILFCHCETSTGVINNLDEISRICLDNNCLCFADCISSAGTRPLDLSRIAMATASSGKGLAAIPGLAIIFSNIKMISSSSTPVYFDLANYHDKKGIPFTISSNVLSALNVSIKQKLHYKQYQLIDRYSAYCYDLLNQNNLLPFNNAGSKVFTISKACTIGRNLFGYLAEEQIRVSYESEYLKKRDWFQVALFGYYKEKELNWFLQKLQSAMTVAADLTRVELAH